MKSPNEFPGVSHRKKRAFLAAFERVWTIQAAAKAAGIDRRTHTNWMHADPAYAAAFEQAMEYTTQRMEETAIQHAADGWEEPVYQGGEMVGTIRRFDSTMMIFMLKARRPEVYRERWQLEHTGPNGKAIPIALFDAIADKT